MCLIVAMKKFFVFPAVIAVAALEPVTRARAAVES